MKKMCIFEPAMCCPTGLCGVSVDSDLLRISTIVNNLKNNGVNVERFNLTNEPMEFVKNREVNELISNEGVEILPITVVDSKIVKTKAYPSNSEMAEWLGVPSTYIEIDDVISKNKGCGGCDCNGGC